MSVKFTCDVCGIEINGSESVNVLRMWNLPRADAIAVSGLPGIAFDEDFHLCDECFENVANHAASRAGGKRK